MAELPLPVAGLLSFESVNKVVNAYHAVEKAALDLGSVTPAPFAILSFLALPVIPELRLTDLGLIDVLSFKIIG
jgi:adenine deaminase